MEQGGAVKADSQAEAGRQLHGQAEARTEAQTEARIEAHTEAHIEAARQLRGEAKACTEAQPLLPSLACFCIHSYANDHCIAISLKGSNIGWLHQLKM